MTKIAMMLAILLAIFAFGCGEQGNPAPADENSETSENADTVEDGNGDVADASNAAASGTVSSFEYAAPEVGQWISYAVEGEEGEFKLSIVAEEDYEDVSCLWYQIEVDGEAVAQILLDPSLMAELMVAGNEYMDEFVADPVAYIEENMPEDGNYMDNEEAIENMMLFLTAIKQIKVNDGTQLMLLDMAGVPALVEQMIAENPDMLGESMEFNPSEDPEFEEFMTELDNAEFSLDEVEIDGVSCLQFNATHNEEGTIQVAVSDELPILPLYEARVTPSDPEDEGGFVYVSGFGFEGAENLMTQAPDQTIPLAMMLQGMASQMQQ